MPISQTVFTRANILLLAAGGVVLLVIVATSLALTTASQRYFAEVVAARDIRSAAADLLSRLQDAETGQRGFLLTRDRAYLAPYTDAIDRIDGNFARLADTVQNLPQISGDLDGLGRHVREKIAELESTVALAQRGDFDGALAIVRAGAGNRLMDELRGELTALVRSSEASLRDAIASQETASTLQRWVTIGGAAMLLAMAAVAAWTILTFTRELTTAHREVAGLNVGLEERVRQRTEALTKANDEIQRFAYIVTHDLRAPLVNIMGFTSELETNFKPIQAYIGAEGEAPPQLKAEADAALKTEVPEALDFIRSSTRKMDALINAILRISREGTRRLKPERIDLDAVLAAAADSVHHQAGTDGGGIVVDSRAGVIVSDRLSIDQIVGNLLDNAIKYRLPGRPVEIVARSRRESGGRARIEIEDNGRGIASGDTERVFELFRRSGTQNTRGEGIGLAHVRTLVRNLGGDITLRSELGAGTTFTVILPPDLKAIQRSSAS